MLPLLQPQKMLQGKPPAGVVRQSPMAVAMEMVRPVVPFLVDDDYVDLRPPGSLAITALCLL